jgi:hypothetical protein
MRLTFWKTLVTVFALVVSGIILYYSSSTIRKKAGELVARRKEAGEKIDHTNYEELLQQEIETLSNDRAEEIVKKFHSAFGVKG